MRTEYLLFVHHTTSILAKLSTQCFEHSGDISRFLLVNPSHTDEPWEERNTCLWIYIYIYIKLLYINFSIKIQLPRGQNQTIHQGTASFTQSLSQQYYQFNQKVTWSLVIRLGPKALLSPSIGFESADQDQLWATEKKVDSLR